VKPVTKFMLYLLSDIDSDRHSIAEIHRRLGLANYIMGQLMGSRNNKSLAWAPSYDCRLCFTSPVHIFTDLRHEKDGQGEIQTSRM